MNVLVASTRLQISSRSSSMNLESCRSMSYAVDTGLALQLECAVDESHSLVIQRKRKRCHSATSSLQEAETCPSTPVATPPPHATLLQDRAEPKTVIVMPIPVRATEGIKLQL